jgi:hypothetical protein
VLEGAGKELSSNAKERFIVIVSFIKELQAPQR